MKINKLGITNFKSFGQMEVELGNFNVLIGANAAGKSNFVQIFRFLKDVADDGLDNAISMQGGEEYFLNMYHRSAREFSFSVKMTDLPHLALMENDLLGIKVSELNYRFSLGFKPILHIIEDNLSVDLGYYGMEKGSHSYNESEKKGDGQIIISKNPEGTYGCCKYLPEQYEGFVEDILWPSYQLNMPSSPLLLETPFFIPIPPYKKIFEKVSIYDIDTKYSKNAIPAAGKLNLEEDGSNLAFVLQRILDDQEKKRMFLNLLRDLLPFVKEVGTTRFTEKTLLLTISEIYNDQLSMPSSLISDGTINLTTLLIPLFFEEKSVIIIEEPERNIHPQLLSKVVSLFKDAARNKQIIITTHSPEIVRHAGLENLFLISRDKDGFSQIRRPGEKKEVTVFLENDIGLDELYIQNFWEG